MTELQLPTAAAVNGEIIAPTDKSVRVVYQTSPVQTAHRTLHVAPGASLQDILEEAVPDRAMHRYAHAQICGTPIPRDRWRLVRPKPGTSVVLTLVPQGGGGNKILRMVLMIAVTALAAAATWYIGGLGAPIAAAAVGAAIGIGGSVLGPTLIGSTKSPRRLECRCSR